ncbi:MAG: NAD-dependent epimerase/dehydratase family protein [Lentisphaerae bacterium]|nr:NAD-dependent epimerase/dehydratase family protein [Lentisphaerota bacterium]
MNILLIGGSGFVSGTLAREALAAGHAVWAVSRGKRPAVPGVHALAVDRKDRAAFATTVRAAAVRWDLAVDCIGFEPADAEQDRDVLGDCVSHLVFISTDFVFDPGRRTFPQLAENPHVVSDGYGGNKRRCEVILLPGAPGGMVCTVVRPCHIYGPGSELGCLPLHSRDRDLIARLRRGNALKLVGGGHFLQQPILARDLARLILSCAGRVETHGRVYQAAGPDVVESREYYRLIAEALGVELRVEEVAVSAYRAEHPDAAAFLCHRIYDTEPLRAAGLAVPSTPLAEGLREQVAALLARAGD